jgi:hypothetical protein
MSLEKITIDPEVLIWLRGVVRKSKKPEMSAMAEDKKGIYSMAGMLRRFETGLSTGELSQTDVRLYHLQADYYKRAKAEGKLGLEKA